MYIEANQVPNHLRLGYTGKKFQVEAVESVKIPSYAGLWDGGSRTTYTAIELATGNSVTASDNSSAPWDDTRKDRLFALRSGYAVVRHQISQGHDLGLTFYVHPSDIVKLIPENKSADLTEQELKFLAVIRGIKSGYRNEYFARMGLKQADIEALKDKFTSLGYLNKAGAITVAGKNICADIHPY